MLWYLRGVAPLRWLVWLMMLVALIMWVASLITPNPGALGAPDNLTPRGILKLTRHPGFVAFAIFGFAHMLMNGWAGDLVFFGTFPALGIFGGCIRTVASCARWASATAVSSSRPLSCPARRC